MDDRQRKGEQARIKDALQHLITLRGQIQVEGTTLGGSLGTLLQRELGKRFDPQGPDPTVRQLARWFESSYHHMRGVVAAVGVANRAPVKVSGVLAGWEPWARLRDRMQLDTHLASRTDLAIGVGSCGIRPTWSMRPGVLPALCAVPSSHISAWGSEANPLDPVGLIQRVGYPSSDGERFVETQAIYWDISDMERPRFSVWRSEAEARLDRGVRYLDMSGDRYPWREADGEPVIPWMLYQGQPDSMALLPVSGLAPTTWELMVRLTWATFAEVIRGWDIPMPYGEEEIKGLDQSVARPHAYVPIHGKGIHGVAIAPSAVPSVEGRMRIWREKVAMAADRYDRRLHVVDRKEAASGVALELEASQEYAAFSDQESRWSGADARALHFWRMTWNRWVEMGVLSAERIPDGDIGVAYTPYLSPQAQERLAAQERQAMIDGPGSPVTYHCVRRGMDWRDPTQRMSARDELDIIRQERQDYADLLPRPQSPITIAPSAPPAPSGGSS